MMRAWTRSPSSWNSPGICSERGHNTLDAAEGHDHGRALEAQDVAGDDLADLVLVLLVDAAALVLAEQLDHHLLDGLGADAAHLLLGEELAAAPHSDFAGLSDDLGLELVDVLDLVLAAQAAGDGLLDVEEDGLAFDAAVAGDGVDDADELGVHGRVGYSVVGRDVKAAAPGGGRPWPGG